MSFRHRSTVKYLPGSCSFWMHLCWSYKVHILSALMEERFTVKKNYACFSKNILMKIDYGTSGKDLLWKAKLAAEPWSYQWRHSDSESVYVMTLCGIMRDSLYSKSLLKKKAEQFAAVYQENRIFRSKQSRHLTDKCILAKEVQERVTESLNRI